MSAQQMDYWAQIQEQQYIPGGDASLELSTDMPLTPSLSASPVMSEFDSYASPKLYQPQYGQASTDEMKFQYQLPITPVEWSADEPTYCPPAQQMPELTFPSIQSPVAAGAIPIARGESRKPATSGRRRAQNRAAQRAFRERKEQHARDLESALSALTEKYQSLETSHSELSTAYEKLKKTIELLTKDDDGTDEARSGHSKETLRSLLEIIHGEVGARAGKAKQ